MEVTSLRKFVVKTLSNHGQLTVKYGLTSEDDVVLLELPVGVLPQSVLWRLHAEAPPSVHIVVGEVQHPGTLT